MRIGKRKAFKNAFSKAFECRNLMGFILFKSGFIMDQKGIKVFMKSLLQIYHTTFSENLVKILGVSYDISTYLKPNVDSIDTYILRFSPSS